MGAMKKKTEEIAYAPANTKGIAVPEEVLKELKEIVDVLARVLDVPAALIKRVEHLHLKVLCAGRSKDNPYKRGDKMFAAGQFCEKVINSKKKLLVADALKDRKWKKSDEVRSGFVSYLGCVLLWPDENVFGTICVLDRRENHFSPLFEKLLFRFKKAVESQLSLLHYDFERQVNNIHRRGAEEKLESVGILAGGIAQDFNSLLSVIIGNISLARMEVPPGEKVYDLLLESEKASCQAADIAEKLITFSEGGWLVRREERLAGLLQDVIGSLFFSSGILWHTDLPADLFSIFVDEGQFKQVLCNILHNAADAMPDGGELRIRARNITVDKDENPALKPGKYVKVLIKDRGRGIPKKDIDKIFDPYFSTKNSVNQKGMGLGLSICYSIIRKHGGWIKVESEKGVGTSVHIYIPAFSEASENESFNM